MMKKKFIIISSFIAFQFCVLATSQEERLLELERIACYEPSDVLDDIPEEIPSPDDMKKKYDISDVQLYQDILEMTKRYSVAETNSEKVICRQSAVLWLGLYGSTNDIPYVKTFLMNPRDRAQESAIYAVLNLTLPTEMYISTARSIITNKTIFSQGLIDLVYSSLHKKCMRGRSSQYIDNPGLHSRVAAFFLERAALEETSTLYVDCVACELNPTYRHSQQRRDNLARLRKPGLTGLPAQFYDAAQRDAQPKEQK